MNCYSYPKLALGTRETLPTRLLARESPPSVPMCNLKDRLSKHPEKTHLMTLLQKELIHCVLEKENGELIQPSQGKNSKAAILSEAWQFPCSAMIDGTTIDLLSKRRSHCHIKDQCKNGLRSIFFSFWWGADSDWKQTDALCVSPWTAVRGPALNRKPWWR